MPANAIPVIILVAAAYGIFIVTLGSVTLWSNGKPSK